MNRKQALSVFREWDRKGKYVFTKHELAKLFPDDVPKTLAAGLNRLVKAGLVQRACRNIYVNLDANSANQHIIEHIAKALRKGEYNYVSLESMLAEFGVISQIPIDRLTIMTTGRKGLYKTPYGVIEFTHTKRSVDNILESTKYIKDRPLRIAKKQTAWRDLKRAGRNVHLVNQADLNNEE